MSAPHWKYFQLGQLWYDWRVHVIRQIVGIGPGLVYASDVGNPGYLLVFPWRKASPNDNQVIRSWCLLT